MTDTPRSDGRPYADAETLRRLYWDEGESMTAIGARWGVTEGCIHYWMDRHGIPRRPQGVGGGVPSSKGKVREGVWGWDAEGNYRRLDAPGGEA